MNYAYMSAWGIFLGLVLVMLAIDLFVLHRKAHEIRFKEALLGTFIPISMALLFMIFVYYAYQFHWFDLGILDKSIKPENLIYWPTNGAEATILYLTGYLVELSLSADNVFLFVVLMGFFAVPPALQHRVLFWGVFGALVMRAVLIGSVALLVKFKIVIFLFGLFLIFTGIKMLFSKEEEGDPSQSWVIRLAKKVLPIYPHYEGGKFFVRPPEHAGKLMATNLFLVLVAIEFTDLVFALDSIPAIFGITQDPFIVFTSNVFAILGLRSMYFLLAGVMDKFHFLKYGLSIVLAFVGVKMSLPIIGHYYGEWVSHQTHHWEINKYVSLGVIAGVLTLTIVASLVFPKKLHIVTETSIDSAP